ncbi:MAG: hypothetical protein RLZZ618_4054 [Pseudomonadota bacterium]|jgi:hypothetical protein
MIKTVFIVLAVAVAAFLLFAATRPDTFAVERSITISAPPAKVHALIDDLRAYNTWNPYAKKDPQMKLTYRGAPKGVGAGFDFEGNKESGKGSIDVLESDAGKVVMALRMTSPMEADNRVVYKLVPKGDATEVSWTMGGAVPYMAKVIHLVINIDKMVGKDFEQGLSDLKSLAEKP